MHASWLYQQNPLFIILTLLLAMTTAAEVGFRLGRRWHARSGDAGRVHFGSILGSLLGLLALLLSFTFAMSANRFDSRRQLVLADANALETLYLQSDLLPDASRKAFKQSLRHVRGLPLADRAPAPRCDSGGNGRPFRQVGRHPRANVEGG